MAAPLCSFRRTARSGSAERWVGQNATVLDAAPLDDGVGVTWRDEKGMHLTVVTTDGLESAPAPPSGDVVHLAQSGDDTVALVSESGAIHAYELDER